jgi:hypothetical protein
MAWAQANVVLNSGMTVAEEIQGVIITASARLVSNPTQASSESESYPLLRFGKDGQPFRGRARTKGR